ncbi:hypothetical protein EV191_1137 [Tamaricihabitans halophyticus]|uniref:Phosphotransferase family enzyme n=1 Tax=Tamaricihabitans halophyticus TaxID=1262583 RepID=A0A4R2QIB7_9PSEU|nr:aminoglycoside phosphotransferase [Tamaricihabitans halophyticus]TCP46731.1 hypothetical protein EV191_1137 [Tamaricihabitans halophyticus]
MTSIADPAGVVARSWSELPDRVHRAVQAELGVEVIRSLRQTGEIDGSVVCRLRLADGNWAFAKALPTGHPLIGTYRAEAEVSAHLPELAPVPQLRGVVEQDWLVLLFADIDGTKPNLRPGSPDLGSVLATLGRAARTLTPAPIPDAREALDDLGLLLRGWQELQAIPGVALDPWAERNLDSLVMLESAWHPWAAGDTLLHNDIRPETMVKVGPGKVLLVDWCYPARGAAWLDTASLVPQLLLAGHAVGKAERLVLRRPELVDVPAWAVTGFATALAGHWERCSRLPEQVGLEGNRAYQARAAAAALRWVAHRTRWS